MKLIKEFKDFVMKGNVVDLAVAVIIGGAFGQVISSFVADVLMPPIGVLLGGINFTDIKINLNGAVTMNIGNFIQSLVDFIIIASVIFILIKVMSRIRHKDIIAPAKPSPEAELLAEMR